MAKYFNKDAKVLVIDNEEIEVKDGICELTEEQYQKVKWCGFEPYVEPEEIAKEEKPKRHTKAK